MSNKNFLEENVPNSSSDFLQFNLTRIFFYFFLYYNIFFTFDHKARILNEREPLMSSIFGYFCFTWREPRYGGYKNL